MSKPPTVAELIWERDLVLSGTAGGIPITLDSDSVAGISPMQAVGAGLAACMAMDVVVILRKGRQNLRGLRVSLMGNRAAEEPRRFTAVTIHFDITGDIPNEPVQRAIDLSRNKYCSVWQSLRQDIDLDVTFDIRRSR
jgi:putative redox protein